MDGTNRHRIIEKVSSEISLAANAVILLDLYNHLPGTGKRDIDSIPQKIADLMEESPYLVSITNTSGYFVCVNRTWLKEFGWSFLELTSKPFFDFIHPEDIPKSLKAMEDISLFGSDIENYKTFENRYKAKSGDYKLVKWRIHNEYHPGKSLFVSIAEIG